MIKNAIIYKIGQGIPDLATLEATLQTAAFQPCTPSQEKSEGWVPPRGEAHGALAESIGGQWILRYRCDAKLLPASVMQQRVQEKCDAIERECGRKPGKKERRDLQEEARRDLLPQAFATASTVWLWIDPQAGWLVLDTPSQARADAVVSLLVQCMPPGFALALLDTQVSPEAAMAHWLLAQEAPPGFALGRECELKAADGSGAVVRYGSHILDIEEVRQHVQQGKHVRWLALEWQGRTSFVLTAGLGLKKLCFAGAALERAQMQGEDESSFDAEVAIVTGELTRLLLELIAALDGEGRCAVMQGEAA